MVYDYRLILWKDTFVAAYLAAVFESLCFGFSMLLCVLCSLDAATLPTSGETRPGIGAPSGACSGRREGETTRSSCPRTGVCLRLHYIS